MIQSRQARTSQLSSFDLFRRPYLGYLVRLAFRRCPFRERSSSALGGLPKENSQIPLPHQNSRQLVFSTTSSSSRSTRKDCLCSRGQMTQSIQERVQNLRYRTFRKGGWQAAQFTYQPHNWKRLHRFIVVRRPKPKSREEDNQLTLWEFKDYFYHTFVTNLSVEPGKRVAFLQTQSPLRTDIRELKESFPLGNIPTNSFLANQVNFHLILLTYDLVNWFKRMRLPQEWNSAALHTLRRDLFALPACLVHAGGKNQLKLPQRYPHQKLFIKPQQNRTSQNYIDLSKNSFLVSSILRENTAIRRFFRLIKDVSSLISA